MGQIELHVKKTTKSRNGSGKGNAFTRKVFFCSKLSKQNSAHAQITNTRTHTHRYTPNTCTHTHTHTHKLLFKVGD